MDTLFDKPETLGDFEAYDLAHPQIWNEFKKTTFLLISKRFKHYSAKAIFEIVRFHRSIETGETPKLNNNWTAYYARKFMKQNPVYGGFFETRRSKLDKQPK